MTGRPGSLSRKGFTLIELLVVIAIIAILAAILMPVFAQAREKARTISCLSNLKNTGMAMLMYQQDYDEIILPWFTQTNLPRQPGSSDPYLVRADLNTWAQLVQPYMKNTQVLYCPSFEERVLIENAAHPRCDGAGIRSWFPARFYYSHYGLAFAAIFGGCTSDDPRNAFPGNDVRVQPLKNMAAINRPAETAILQDNFTARIANNVSVGTAFGCECGYEGLGRSRHHQGCNYVFIDGHAKQISGNPERTPTIPCPGAFGNPNCICSRYITYDY